MKALFDLHTHTLASGHAFSTLKENLEEAKQKGLWGIGTSDHAEKMPGTNASLFINYKVVRNSCMGLRVFCGVETNICDFHGTIDMEEPLLQKMDYVIASLHSPCIQSGTAEQNTAALLGVMKNPYVKIIAHPDDSRYPLDYDVLVSAAKKHRVALELNNSSLVPGSTRVNGKENAKKLLQTCKKFQAPIILGSDAHIWYDVGRFDEAYDLIKEVSFPEELILNLHEDGIHAVLNHRKK
ncbi:MAG: phosphatase [Oscillospiraceae bacterium]|nr:phosphatase [Oscillospiraceae bacterium]